MHPYSCITILALGLFCWGCSQQSAQPLSPPPVPQPVQFNSAEQAKHIHSADSFDEGNAWCAGVDQMPPLDVAIMHDVAFHCHSGKHEVTAFDWRQILKFADMKLKPPEQQ